MVKKLEIKEQCSSCGSELFWNIERKGCCMNASCTEAFDFSKISNKNKFKVGDKVSPIKPNPIPSFLDQAEKFGYVEKIDRDKKGFIYWVVSLPTNFWHGWFREEELMKIK